MYRDLHCAPSLPASSSSPARHTPIVTIPNKSGNPNLVLIYLMTLGPKSTPLATNIAKLRPVKTETTCQSQYRAVHARAN